MITTLVLQILNALQRPVLKTSVHLVITQQTLELIAMVTVVPLMMTVSLELVMVGNVLVV